MLPTWRAWKNFRRCQGHDIPFRAPSLTMTSRSSFALSRNPFASRGLGRLARFTLVALTLLFGALETRAELYQTICVNVMSPENFRIGRKVYRLEEMTAVVKGEVRGTDRIAIKLFIPLGIRKEVRADILARCREAGATSFFIVYKS